LHAIRKCVLGRYTQTRAVGPIRTRVLWAAVLCHAGIRSMQMATFLTSKAGFTRVFNVEGGIHAYAQIDPSVPFY
jgi:hypothetical protein